MGTVDVLVRQQHIHPFCMRKVLEVTGSRWLHDLGDFFFLVHWSQICWLWGHKGSLLANSSKARLQLFPFVNSTSSEAECASPEDSHMHRPNHHSYQCFYQRENKWHPCGHKQRGQPIPPCLITGVEVCSI